MAKSKTSSYEVVRRRKDTSADYWRAQGKDDLARRLEDESVEDFAARKGITLRNPRRPRSKVSQMRVPHRSLHRVGNRSIKGADKKPHRRSAGKRKRNAGTGDVVNFHGAFKKKSEAVEKEQKTPGAFIRFSPANGGRFMVMSRRNPRAGLRKKNVEFGEYSKGVFHPWTMRPVTSRKKAKRGARKVPRGRDLRKVVKRLKNPKGGLLKKLWKELKPGAKQILAAARAPRKVGATARSKAKPPAGGDAGVISALQNLGYKGPQARALAAHAASKGGNFDQQLRTAMQAARKANPGRRLNPTEIARIKQELAKVGFPGAKLQFESGGWTHVTVSQPYSAGAIRTISNAVEKATRRDGAAQLVTVMFKKPSQQQKRNNAPVDVCSICKRSDGDVKMRTVAGQQRPICKYCSASLRGVLSVQGKRAKSNPRRRKNPGMDNAAELYKDFHGKDAKHINTYKQTLLAENKFTKLGDLVKLIVDRKYVIEFVEGSGTILACDPKGRQLFVLGGDQSIDQLMDLLKVDRSKHLIDVGALTTIEYFTHKQFDKFTPITYVHKMGEEGGEIPSLMYDRPSRQLHIVGGDYKVKPEGIVN